MNTTAPPNAQQALAQLEAAAQRLQMGRPGEARTMLEQVLQVAPHSSDALHLYGVSLRMLGDPVAAELPVRQAIGVDKTQPGYHVTLGDILRQLGWPDKAEASYRAALALNRRFVPAVRQLTLLLTDIGRPVEALQVITPLVVGGTPDYALLTAHAGALKAAGRVDEALVVYQQAVLAAPSSGVAEHNVAATLGDLGRNREAEGAVRRAFAKGLNAPETRLVHARALAAHGEFDQAETALRTALSQQPIYLDVHRDLAQLIWMRTEDQKLATAEIDAALVKDPGAVALRQLKAKVLTFAGDDQGADAVLQEAAQRHPDDAALLMSASSAAIKVADLDRALEQARRAQTLSPPNDGLANTFVCEVLLALGRADEVEVLLQELLREFPHAQQSLAYLATARRLMGDQRYRELYDYDAFVRPAVIDTPNGWSSLDAYLADLTGALQVQHKLKTHPLDQSLRNGSQLSNVLQLDDPALKAFGQALDGPIRAYMAALGEGKDPLRSRNTGNYRFQGVWSVKLRPGGGRHVDHIHPEGWLSSACYIDLPKAIEGEGNQGWIKFGEPGIPTQPKLGPERFVKPEPGLLVLFPSYMWHGTVPFEGDDSRLTIAFDVVPAPR